MKQIFGGYGPARDHAQAESKKQQKELYVVKSSNGGIHYYVTPNKENVKGKEKILGHYKNGETIIAR